MLKPILIIILAFTIQNAFSQTEIFSGFNATHSGRSITITASNTKNKKHEFGGGIRFNINRIKHPDDQNNIFFKRLYATKPLHYFGVEGFYYRYILKQWQNLKPFLFYDLQVSYSTTRNRGFLPFTYDSTTKIILYKEYLENFGPFTWVEQNIGLGFKVDLPSNFFFYEKAGFGTSFILGYDNQLLDKIFNWFTWEFGPLLNVGIGYRFKKK